MARRATPLIKERLVTFSEAADHLRVPVGWIRGRIEERTLTVVVADGIPMLTQEQLDTFASSEAYWAHKDGEHARSLQVPYVPDRLRDYHRFHKALNDFTWILKGLYSSREDMKRGKFRLDHLLQRYLAEVPATDKIAKLMSVNGPVTLAISRAASSSLKKVWLNELAYVTPQVDSPLILDKRGVAANLASAGDRLAFPSWRISQAYYVNYHASRAISDLWGLSYRAEEHHAPMRALKNGALAPLSKTVIRLPFNLAVRSQVPSFSAFGLVEARPHLKYGYAAHPRPPRLSFVETGQGVMDAFHAARKLGWSSRASGEPFMLADLLYQFRVWANYVDVENIVALKSSGFRAYLDLDLHTIIYFLAAIVELVALARLGPERVLLLAEEFHHDFVKGDERLWSTTALHPLNVRLSIYEHMGRLGGFRWRPTLPPPSVAVELLKL